MGCLNGNVSSTKTKYRVNLWKLFYFKGISTSNNKYDPPCRSKPSLTFFDKIKSSLLSIKLINEKKDKITMIKYIINNLIFEKYNTKYNYFFVLG